MSKNFNRINEIKIKFEKRKLRKNVILYDNINANDNTNTNEKAILYQNQLEECKIIKNLINS